MTVYLNYISTMVWESPNVLSAKQLAKYQRQKCINLLEKITKNLFRMFRNTEIPQDVLVDRFFVLYNKLAEFKTAHLYAIYHIEMKNYIEEVASLCRESRDIDSVRDNQMTRLNRLQKLKNATKYKKEKHTKKLG